MTNVTEGQRPRPHVESTERREAARIYMILAKLSELNICILAEMNAKKFEQGINGESLDDLRGAMGKVTCRVRDLWLPMLDDFTKWEDKGTPEEAVAVSGVKEYTAGLLGMSNEDEKIPCQRLSEARRRRMLDKLLGLPLPADRSLVPRLWAPFLQILRRFRRRSGTRRFGSL